MKISPLDIVFIVILAGAAIRCTFRGFISEVLSMAALILGVLGAIFFSKAGATLIDGYIGVSRWNQIIAFLVIFVLVYLVIKLIEHLLRRILERINLEKLDRTLGFFLGLFEGILVVVLAVYLMKVQPIFDLDLLLEKSWIAGLVLEVLPIAAPALTESIQKSDV